MKKDKLEELIPVFKKFVEDHPYFQALEDLPTLYHKVDVFYYPKEDCIEIQIIARAFEEDKSTRKYFAFKSELWGRMWKHTRDMDIEVSKEEITDRLEALKEDITKEGFSLNKKYVLWAREEYKKKPHASRWIIL